MKKRNILIVAIVLMVVGFASVTTNLMVKGSITLGNDIKDYDIKFTKSILNNIEINSLISSDGKKINYNINLTKTNKTSELVYEITNNSKQYDAKVNITCKANENINPDTYTIDTTNIPDVIKAREYASGSIIISMIGEEEINGSFECSLSLNSLTTTSPKVYGIKRLIETSDTKWERIEDSVGLVANATHDGESVQNDFDNVYPWSDIITYNYDDETKTETAYIGEDNFKFDGSNGQVLTRIPEFYYKREQKDGYEYIYISQNSQEGYTKSEAFSVGRYTMSGDSSKVYSRSGFISLGNATIADFRAYARNLDIETNQFGQLDWRYFIIQLLYLVEYADYNSQSILGLGNTDNTVAIASGGCDTLLMKSGTLNNDGKHSVIYRGVEDIYGNYWQFIDGININNHVAYINYDPATYSPDTFTGDYQMIGYTNAKENGYIRQLGYDESHPLISFPTVVEENSDNYINDYYRQDTENRIVLIGGSFLENSKSGLWCWVTKDLSSAIWRGSGARLIRYQ